MDTQCMVLEIIFKHQEINVILTDHRTDQLQITCRLYTMSFYFQYYFLFACIIYFIKCPYDLIMFLLYAWSVLITVKLTYKFSKRLGPPHHHNFILNRIKMNRNDRHNKFWK
jgi:hypothetical protein